MELILQGFFIECDKYNRVKIMFLDDYDGSYDNGLKKKEMSFTKSYISKKSTLKNGKSPMSDDNTCFNVKYSKKNVGYINDEPVPLLDLKQHKVEMIVKVSHYNFTKLGNNFQGWNIKLIKMSLIEM